MIQVVQDDHIDAVWQVSVAGIGERLSRPLNAGSPDISAQVNRHRHYQPAAIAGLRVREFHQCLNRLLDLAAGIHFEDLLDIIDGLLHIQHARFDHILLLEEQDFWCNGFGHKFSILARESVLRAPSVSRPQNVALIP